MHEGRSEGMQLMSFVGKYKEQQAIELPLPSSYGGIRQPNNHESKVVRRGLRGP